MRVEPFAFEARPSVMDAITQRSVACYVRLTNQIVPVRYKFKKVVVCESLGEQSFRIADSIAFITVDVFDERKIFGLVFDYCGIPRHLHAFLGQFLQFCLECALELPDFTPRPGNVQLLQDVCSTISDPKQRKTFATMLATGISIVLDKTQKKSLTRARLLCADECGDERAFLRQVFKLLRPELDTHRDIKYDQTLLMQAAVKILVPD